MFGKNSRNMSSHEIATAPARPRLYQNCVLTILDTNFCVIGQGRVDRFDMNHITLTRLPGVLTMPPVNLGEKLYLQGENESEKTFTLEITVQDASRLYISGENLNPVETPHRRMHTRYIINRQAWVLNQTKRQEITQVCDLIDISMGGAKIISNYEYPIDKQIRLRVELYDNSGPISFVSQIVRVKPLDNARIEYGLIFAELSAQQRKYLTEDLQIVRDRQNKIK